MTEDVERICANWHSFFPDAHDITGFGICLADPAFEPYLDELIDNYNFDVCRQLIEEKRFSCSREACPEYDEAEFSDPEEDILAEMINLQVPDPGDAPSSSRNTLFRTTPLPGCWSMTSACGTCGRSTGAGAWIEAGLSDF